jgi:predicted cupin superfamily sugar epimerase
MLTLNSLIDQLQLVPHPEGGYYREIHRSNELVCLVDGLESKSAYTSIYYLLSGGDFSSWHRIKSDETWFFHSGCDVVIYYLDENKSMNNIQLGHDSKAYQATIFSNTWFAAKPATEDSFCLGSCVVARGFEFREFELGKREELIKEFGVTTESKRLITTLTRP